MLGGRSRNARKRVRTADTSQEQKSFLLARLGWPPGDAVAFVVAIVALVAILVNTLSLQSGSHPAPLFQPVEVEKTVQPAAKPTQAAPLPKVDVTSAPVTPKLGAPHAPRTPGEIITDVQRELVRRGYYDGPADGLSMAHARTVQSAISSVPQASNLAHSPPPKGCSRPLRSRRSNRQSTMEALPSLGRAEFQLSRQLNQ